MTDYNSTNKAIVALDDGSKIGPGLHNSQVKCMYDSYLTVGNILTTDEILFNNIPEGAKILEAVIKSESLGTAGIIQLGLKAYTDQDGNAVAEDADALVDLADAGGQVVVKRSDLASALQLAQVGKGGAQPFINITENSDGGAGETIEIYVYYMLQN